jgi:hypothetical protein
MKQTVSIQSEPPSCPNHFPLLNFPILSVLFCSKHRIQSQTFHARDSEVNLELHREYKKGGNYQNQTAKRKAGKTNKMKTSYILAAVALATGMYSSSPQFCLHN